jgi:hypothetical protein
MRAGPQFWPRMFVISACRPSITPGPVVITAGFIG